MNPPDEMPFQHLTELLHCLNRADQAAAQLARELTGEPYTFTDYIATHLHELLQHTRALEASLEKDQLNRHGS